MSRRQGRKSRRPMAGSIVDPIGMDAAALPPPGVDFGSEGAAGGTSTSSSPIPVPGSTTSSTGPRNHHHPAVMQSHHSEHMFTATGQIMTAAQRSEYCHRRGLCEGCGVRTHDIHGLGLVVSRPVTNENVYNGICKRCRPRRVRTAMERDGVELEADGAHMPVLAATNGSLTAGAIAEEAAGRLVDDVADESLNIDYIHRHSSTAGDGRNGSSGTEDARTSRSTGPGRKKSSRVSFLSSGVSSGGKLRDSFLSNDGSTGDDGFDAQGDGNADADDMNSDSEGQSTRSSSLHNSKATGASKRRFAKKLWKKAKHISMMAIPAGTSSKSLATDSCKSLALEEAVDDASRREPGEDMSMGSRGEAHDADGSDTPRKSAKSSLTEADESKHLLPVISTEKEALQIMKHRADETAIVVYALRELVRIIEENDEMGKKGTVEGASEPTPNTGGEADSESVQGSDSRDEDVSNVKDADLSSNSEDIELLETLSLVLQRHIDNQDILEVTAEVFHVKMKESAIACDRAEENLRTFGQLSPHFKTLIGILLDASSVAVKQLALKSMAVMLEYIYFNADGLGDDSISRYCKELGAMNMWKTCTTLLWNESAPIRVKGVAFSLLISLDNVDNRTEANLELLVIASNLLRAFPGSATLMCMVVPFLADALPESEDMIVEGAGLKKVVQALEIHGNDDETLRQAALAILLELTATPPYWVNDPDLLRKAAEAVAYLPGADTSSLQCDILSNLLLLSNPQHFDDLITRTLIPKMFVHLEAPGLLPALCRLLKSVCVSSPSRAKEIAEAGAIGKLATVAFATDGVNEAKVYALHALCRLILSMEDDIDSLVDTAFIESLQTLLQQNGFDEDGKLCALQITNHLLLVGCQVPYGDILSATCLMIQDSRQAAFLHEHLCRIVSNISVAAAKASFHISPIEPFCALLDLIQRNSSTTNLQKEACAAIYALIIHAENNIEPELLQPVSSCLFGTILEENKAALNSVSVESCEGALRVIDLIGEQILMGNDASYFSPDHVEILVSLAFAAFDSGVSCEGLVTYIIGIFQSLSCQKKTEVMLVEGGCIITVIDALQTYLESIDIQTIGCGILARLCDDSLQVQFACVESEGIEAILSGMARFRTNGDLQASACRALAHLTIDEDARERMSSAGGLGIIASTKEIFSEDEDLQRDATHLLKWLME